MANKKTKGYLSGIWPVALALVALLVGLLCYFSGEWYLEKYGSLGFDSILYTLTADMGGVEKELIKSYIKQVSIRVVLSFTLVWLLLFFPFPNKMVLKIRGRKPRSFRIYPFKRPVALLLCLAVALTATAVAAERTEFTTFIYYLGSPSTFYDENYVDPRDVEVTFPEEKRNLIIVYLESMETTFFSKEEGGALETNVIPELYTLAEENLSFSHTEGIGGFYSPPGTRWTVAAMLSQTAGIPLKNTAGAANNEYGQEGEFLPGIYSMTDMLADNGYNQMIMVGSDLSFGGRRTYYTTHGVEEVRDLFTAKDDGIVPEDYYVWWGMEDLYLFEYAKQELTELASREEPFAFSMLTVDTHQIDGYKCRLCENTYKEQYENVYRCSSRQTAQFISWIQEQDFYENTTVVVVGDHPTMDGDYIARRTPSGYDRRVYNCILNSAAQTDRVKNRQFTTMDMFPTVLAAMGCEIEGEQLGMGINLFSDKETLMEQLGRENFDHELSRYSDYYMSNFF